MPITSCPGCEASLEVPTVVPEGRVSCPYCGVEFPVKKRSAARGGRRRDDARYEDDRRGGRGRLRKRQDPVPIVVGILAVVILGGALVFILASSSKQKAEIRDARQEEVARLGPAFTTWSGIPDRPDREPQEFPNLYLDKDRVTLRRLTRNMSLSFGEQGSRDKENLVTYVIDVAPMDVEGEFVTSVENGIATHEGTYKLLEYSIGRPLISGFTDISATFKTDRFGRLVNGSFMQTAGPTLNPPPAILGDRNFGVLPAKKVRHMETWGTEDLPNPLAEYVKFDGRPLASIPLDGQRMGGWRWQGGEATYESDGVTWAREAKADFRLKAMENRRLRNGVFRGEPADISATVVWKGDATYKLKKETLVEVMGLTVTVWARAITATTCYEWHGMSATSFQTWKDP